VLMLNWIGPNLEFICGRSDGMGLRAHLQSHQRLVPWSLQLSPKNRDPVDEGCATLAWIIAEQCLSFQVTNID
jgi:hypothetical protein